MTLQPGTVVAGRYRLERRLGEGGMGEVWAAVHAITGKQVALKALKAEKAARPELVHRFFREARAATVVGHENVVEVHDVFSFEGAPIMVMELLEGESLGSKLRREGKLDPSELCTLLVPVISAVGTAHARGIVHRDLKPENIFLARGASGRVTAKVLDFGIAKLAQDETTVDSAALTRTGSMVGTPFYMAPEQAAGERELDHRCDVWALGVICFESLAGRRPFEGDNFGQIFKRIITQEPPSLRELRPDLPEDITALVAGMLVKEPDGRRDLAQVMQVLAAHGTATAAEFGAPFSQSSASLTAESASLAPFGDVGAATLAEPTLASASVSRVEPLLGTLDATTRAYPGPGRSTLASGRGRLAWLAVALTVLAFGSTVIWNATRGLLEGPSAASAAATGVPTTPTLVAPAASTERARHEPTSAPSSVPAHAAATARSKVPAPRASAATPSAQPSAVETSSPKRLPGGILDQEQAPF